MGTDEGHPASQVFSPTGTQRRKKAVGPPGRLVAHVDLRGPPSHLAVCVGHDRAEAGDQLDAGLSQQISGGCQLGVEHVERQLDLVGQAAARLFQQGVALPQDPVDVADERVVAGMDRDQRLVEVAAPLRRTTLDQRQVVGREDRDPQGAEQVAGASQRLAVDLGTVPSAGDELGLEQQVPPSRSASARTTARSAPDRTRASVGAPRNDVSVAR